MQLHMIAILKFYFETKISIYGQIYVVGKEKAFLRLT